MTKKLKKKNNFTQAHQFFVGQTKNLNSCDDWKYRLKGKGKEIKSIYITSFIQYLYFKALRHGSHSFTCIVYCDGGSWSGFEVIRSHQAAAYIAGAALELLLSIVTMLLIFFASAIKRYTSAKQGGKVTSHTTSWKSMHAPPLIIIIIIIVIIIIIIY